MFLLGEVSALAEVRHGTCEESGFERLTKQGCWDAADELGLVSTGVGTRYTFPGGCSRSKQTVTWTDNEDSTADPVEERYLLCKGERVLGAVANGQEPNLPATIQVPYQSHIFNGTGYSRKHLQFLANPFNMTVEVPTKSESASLDTQVKRAVIKSTEDFSKSMRATAHIDAKGWGVTARADFQMSRVSSFSASEAIFIFHAYKDLGFKGWEYAPPFTAAAKEHLCKDGKYFQKNEFEKLYGTYYVAGVYLGSSLDLYVSMTTETTSSDDKISMSLEVAWQGAGESAGGSGSFAQEVTSDSTFSNIECSAKTSGVTAGFLPDCRLDNFQEVIDQYKANSDEGSGTALLLRKFSDHEDYIAMQALCQDHAAQKVNITEGYMDSITNRVVDMMLMRKDMTTRDDSPTACVLNLADQAAAYVDKWSKTTYLEADSVSDMASLKELKAIKDAWDPVENKCMKNIKNCHCLNRNDAQFAKNQFVCDGDTDSDPKRYCESDEICFADGDFRLDYSAKDGCKKVPMCHCDNPHKGVVGLNGFSCDDGSHGWCNEWSECYTTNSFKKGAQETDACTLAKVCKCDHPNDDDNTSITCWEEQGPRGPKPLEKRACGHDEVCYSDIDFLYGNWGEGCVDEDKASFGATLKSAVNLCTKMGKQFKGKAVKLKAKSQEECFDHCQANKKLKGKTCKGWAWKAGSRKPCRLYKTLKGAKDRQGVVMGERDCHPNGNVDPQE